MNNIKNIYFNLWIKGQIFDLKLELMNTSKKVQQILGNSRIAILSSRISKFWGHSKVQLKSISPLLYVLAFTSIWIGMCYSHDMFVNETLVCSSIIVSIAFFRSVERNNTHNS